MAELNHGINIRENEDNIPVTTQSESGIPVVFGTAPVHLTDAPNAAVNKIILCSNINDAKKKLGYSEAFENYTLCQVMKMCFMEYAVGPIAFVNVLDPAKHVKAFSEQTLPVEKSQAVLSLEGVLLDSLTVSNDNNVLVKETDYLLSRSDENVVITITASDVPEQIKVSGKQIDPSAVTDMDVIGGYDEESGKESGLELVRRVYPSTGLVPGILSAPGFSHHPVVGAAIAMKSQKINGCFTAENILDLDTKKYKKASQVEEAKKAAGFNDKSSYLVWPMAQREGLKIYGSAVALAATLSTDVSNGNMPNVTPSNKNAKIDAAILDDGTEVVLDFVQADEINKCGVNTFINTAGWKLWGNYTAAYPEKTVMKEKFWCIRRFFSWMGNNFITNNLAKLDNVANKKLIEQICDEENIKCNGYVASGVCAAASIEFREEDNTEETLQDGILIFRQKVGVFGPAQQIINNLEYDAEAVRSALTA